VTPFKSTWNQVGRVDPQLFSANGKVSVKVPWTTAPLDPSQVRIIVTPNNIRLPDASTTGYTVPAVVVVDQVDHEGFDISVYNAEGQDGEAGFDYLALAETVSSAVSATVMPPDLRFGIGQCKVVLEAGTIGDWGAWAINFSRSFTGGIDDPVLRLLTAHNFGETGLTSEVTPGQQEVQKNAILQYGYTNPRQSFTAAAVGVGCVEYSPSDHVGMAYMARNVDATTGKVGFNWMALIRGANSPSSALNYVVDSGTVDPLYFKAHPSQDEWEHADIQFTRPFAETPVVLVTDFSNSARRDPSADPYPVAVAPTVFNANRFGFTLGARNLEDRAGQTGFFWIAISCSEGCG
jgi:hypothetical protein